MGPPGDYFADAIVLPSDDLFSLSVDLSHNTWEPLEPAHAGEPAETYVGTVRANVDTIVDALQAKGSE